MNSKTLTLDFTGIKTLNDMHTMPRTHLNFFFCLKNGLNALTFRYFHLP